MMELKPICYEADGLTLNGLIVDGSCGKLAPGILVAHEAPGIGDSVKERMRWLAERGYVALASDMYGQAIPLGEAIEQHQKLMTIPGAMLRRARGALDTLAAQPGVDSSRLAAIGFCQGGIVALELARAQAPIKAAVGFHPGFQRPEGSVTAPISAKILMMIGDDDPVIPPEDRAAFAAEMKAAGADWQLVTFGGVGHSYTNKAVDALGYPGFGYHADADRRSWRMMLDLFDATL